MKEYLSQKGIDYTECSIAEEVGDTLVIGFNQNLMEMLQKSGQQTHVPVIVIDDEAVIGFDQRRLDSLLS